MVMKWKDRVVCDLGFYNIVFLRSGGVVLGCVVRCLSTFNQNLKLRQHQPHSNPLQA